jgi:hypothetical protein
VMTARVCASSSTISPERSTGTVSTPPFRAARAAARTPGAACDPARRTTRSEWRPRCPRRGGSGGTRTRRGSG